MSRLRRFAAPLLLAGLSLVLVAALLWAWPSDRYIFLPDVAHPVAPLVTVPPSITEPSSGDTGGVYFVDVIVRKASILERFFPGLREGADVVPADHVIPPGGNDKQRRRLDRQDMSRSQTIAKAVALRALGRPVDAQPVGAIVEAVDPDAPASGKLAAGDRILAANGQPVRTPSDLREVVQPLDPGATVKLTVDGGDGTRELAVKTIRSKDGRTVVGVVVEQDVDVKLPVNVSIDAGQIGGPSAGLAFALDIMEELGHDVDRGHRVAATGELALDGSVLPVGGLKQKTIGAKRAHVDLFLVPAGENAQVARRYADGLRIVPVNNFRQALSALATLKREA